MLFSMLCSCAITIAQSTIVQQFQGIAEASSASGSTVVVTSLHTDVIEGDGGATALGFLYFIPFDSTTTAINFPDLLDGVVVFPNPAVDVLNIDLLNTGVDEVRVSLYSIDGKPVLSELHGTAPSQQARMTVNVQSYPVGMYGLLITDRSDRVLHRQLVTIQR